MVITSGYCTIRLRIDLMYPNTAIKKDRNEITTTDDIIYELNGLTVFSKLDIKQAYHQLELKPKSRNLSTGKIHVGLFRFKRLIHATVSSMEEFEHVIRQTLVGVPACANNSDNIKVCRKHTYDHNKYLKEVLKRLSDIYITLNKKSVFSISHP